MFSGLLGFQARAADNEEVLFKSALQAYQSNDLNACVKRFFALTKLNPQKGLYWFNLGNCLFMSQAYNKSNIAYEKVIQLKSPLAPVAVLNQARGYSKLGNDDKARSLLTSVQGVALPPSLRGEVALELYQLEMYSEAEQQIQQIPPPLDSKTQMLLGLSLMKQNKSAEAEKVLKGLSTTSDLSAVDRNSVQDLLRVLKTPTGFDRNFGLFLDVAYGSTSNAYLEGRSYAPISSPLMRASLGANYRTYQGSDWAQKFAYFLDYENPTTAPELSTQTHSLQVPVTYQNRALEFGFIPYFSTQLWDGSAAYQKIGTLLRVALAPSGSWGAGSDLDVASQKGAGDSLSYMSGTFYSIRPFVSYTLGAWYFQFSWLVGSDGTQDILYSDGSRLPLQHTYQGPGMRAVWRASAASSLAVQVLSLERSYKTNSLPENKHRQDQELNASVKYGYEFSRGWVAYGLVEYNPNKSTLGSDDVRDKNYDSTNALVGISWDVF